MNTIKEKLKKSKIVIIYAVLIMLLSTSIVYLFFGNQNRISFTVESTNELIKEQNVLLEDLKRGRIAQKDSFVYIQKSHETSLKKKDSLSKKEKLAFKEKEKQYNEKIDSLVSIINGFQQSDLEPIRRKKD